LKRSVAVVDVNGRDGGADVNAKNDALSTEPTFFAFSFSSFLSPASLAASVKFALFSRSLSRR
jgi:hypothetical protein